MARDNNLLPSEVQREWLEVQIPHRVRVCYASTKELEALLNNRFWKWPLSAWPAGDDWRAWVKRRCETDAIWEGRLCALRYLIEFVGIKWRKKVPIVAERQDDDCRIDQIAGGQLVPVSSEQAQYLAEVWRGCTKASIHATTADDYMVVEDKERMKALEMVVVHLANTIYSDRPNWFADLVLTMRGSDVEKELVTPARPPATAGRR